VQHDKNQHNNQPIYLKIASFTNHIDGKENAVVFGGEGKYYTHPQEWQ
jgi:hypothetical protein